MALSGSIGNTWRTGYRVQVDWTATQDVINNTSTVTAALKLISLGGSYNINASQLKPVTITIDGTTYSHSANVSLVGSQTKTLFTASKVIQHDNEGKKQISVSGNVNIKVTLSGVYYDNVNTGTLASDLNTIPRASPITLFSNFYIGDSIPVAWTRASTTFTHDISLVAGNVTIATRTGLTTSTTLVLTTDEQNKLYQALYDTPMAKVTLYCQTKSGSTLIGGATAREAIAIVPDSVVPTFTTVLYSEFVDLVKNSIGLGTYVQGLSRLNFTVSGEAGAKYSNIVKYSYLFEGVIYDGKTATSLPIKGSGVIPIVATITDSRGRTATKTVNVTVLAYAPPSITEFTVERCLSNGTLDALGTYAKIIRKGTISSVNSKNQFTYVIYSRLRGTSDWGTAKATGTSALGATTMDSNNVIGTYSALSAFEFRLDLIDKLFTTLSLVVMSVSKVTMSWGKTGVGIGKIHENGVLDVGGEIIGTTVKAENTGNVGMEIRSSNGGIPYLDFAKTSAEDYNVRLINTTSGVLSLLGTFDAPGYRLNGADLFQETMAQNGYIRLGGKFIINFGAFSFMGNSSGSMDTSITFPRAFPTRFSGLFLNINRQAADSWIGGGQLNYRATLTNVRVVCLSDITNGQNHNIEWMAIGY
jgi:hypothetical protein